MWLLITYLHNYKKNNFLLLSLRKIKPKVSLFIVQKKKRSVTANNHNKVSVWFWLLFLLYMFSFMVRYSLYIYHIMQISNCLFCVNKSKSSFAFFTNTGRFFFSYSIKYRLKRKYFFCKPYACLIAIEYIITFTWKWVSKIYYS